MRTVNSESDGGRINIEKGNPLQVAAANYSIVCSLRTGRKCIACSGHRGHRYQAVNPRRSLPARSRTGKDRNNCAAISLAEQNIPVPKREKLGKGVRGKYFQQYTQRSNVVVLKPEIMKVLPISEAVNKALASMLAFSEESQSLRGVKGAKGARRKRA